MPFNNTVSAFATQLPSVTKMNDIKPGWTSLRARMFTSRASSTTDTDSSRSTASSMSETSSAYSQSDSCASRTKVAVSDAELRARAHVAADKLDFRTLTDTSLSKWVWKQNRREFMLFESTGTTDTSAGILHQHHQREILLAGDINCSVDEIAAVLQTRSEAGVNATMKALYANEFIYGALVHAVPLTAATAEDMKDLDSVAPAPSDANYVAVKTSTFVRPNLLARHHEWCFLESFDRSTNGDSLIVTQSSLDAAVLRAGKTAEHARVEQLRGLSTAFLVERIPRTRSVRLVFHGQLEPTPRASTASAPAALSSSSSWSARRQSMRHLNPFDKLSPSATAAATARLQKLVSGVSRIPEIVRRRRVGVQTFASRDALQATTNNRCTCCAKNLRLRSRTKQTQCALCAHRVCDKCVTHEQLETQSGHVSSVLLCTRCRECVDACEYDGIVSASPRDGGDAPSRFSSRVELEVDPMAAALRAKTLLDVLATALEDDQDPGEEEDDHNNGASRGSTRDAAATVMRHFVSAWDYDDDADEWTYHLHPSNTNQQDETDDDVDEIDDDGSSNDDASVETTTRKDVDATLSNLLRAVEQTLTTRASTKSLTECKLANTNGRHYAIDVPPRSATTTVPNSPLPVNEAKRLDVIREHRLLELGEVTELNIICALAAQELGCAISMVTVIDRDDEHILACNASFLHRTTMARSQTFCSHLIMGNTPLLVRHPEADVRFHAMDAVTTHGIRFYCGFPLTARDGTVVGSVCCLDTQQRALTHSQYATMQTLARTASKVVWNRGNATKAHSSR